MIRYKVSYIRVDRKEEIECYIFTSSFINNNKIRVTVTGRWMVDVSISLTHDNYFKFTFILPVEPKVR